MKKNSDGKVFMIRTASEWLLIDAAIAYVFYQSLIAFALFLPAFIPYMKMRMKQAKKAEDLQLSLQFRESILAVSTALNAGYSVENAFIEAFHDMKDMYGDTAPITVEYRQIVARLRDNEQIEHILSDLAKTSGIDDINDFASVFESAKRIGGDMTKIIRRAASNISEKIDVRREIDVSISAKRMETRVMEIVPFGILIYLRMGSSDFLSVLYHGITGRIIMSVGLAVYVLGFFLAEKILDIEV
jgi:tight adherence protein B